MDTPKALLPTGVDEENNEDDDDDDNDNEDDDSPSIASLRSPQERIRT